MIKEIDMTFQEITKTRLSNISRLHLFNIVEEDKEKFLNIFKSYTMESSIEDDDTYFYTYTIDTEDWWDSISTRFYDTPFLYWIVCIVNNITNPFEEIEEGQIIKVLKEEYLYQILKEIKTEGRL